MGNSEDTKSSYLHFLPSVYGETEKDFLNTFLKVFEKILSGIPDNVEIEIGSKKVEVTGISETLNSISQFFHPDTAQKEFLEVIEWLASWVGLVLKENWTEGRKREVIARIIPLYRTRGTRQGLQEFLNIYIDKGVSIDDNFPPFIVGVNSTVGISTMIGIPYFFVVETALSEIDKEARNKKVNNIKTIVNREKPVHTDYIIKWKDVQSLQIEMKEMVDGKENYLSEVEIHTWLWNYE